MKFSEYIGAQFGNPRGVIGKLCCVLMNLINNAMYRGIVNRIELNEDSCVLDIGYGNGYLIQQLHKKAGCALYGIDISRDMLEAAGQKNRKAVAAGKVRLSLGDCCHLQFGDGMFHAVTSVNTIYFWEDTLQGLKEIHRVLGFILFERQDYVELGRRAGFARVSVQEIAAGRSYLIQYRKA